MSILRIQYSGINDKYVAKNDVTSNNTSCESIPYGERVKILH